MHLDCGPGDSDDRGEKGMRRVNAQRSAQLSLADHIVLVLGGPSFGDFRTGDHDKSVTDFPTWRLFFFLPLTYI